MSSLACPFWCVVHRDGATLAERPHEGRRTVVEGSNDLTVSIVLLQDERTGRPHLEVDVDGRAALLSVSDAQPLIQALREHAGMAQRAGAAQ